MRGVAQRRAKFLVALLRIPLRTLRLCGESLHPMTTGPEFVASSSLSVHTLPDGTRIRDNEITGPVVMG